MSWRPGEVWLDTDVLWLGAGDGAPAVAGVETAWIPDLGPPPGLLASRERRAAWKRRRQARRARATAVALSPALMLSLLGLRSERDPVSRSFLDDPPSQTYRVRTGSVGLSVGQSRPSVARDRGDEARGSPSASDPRVQQSAAGAAGAPKIEWRRATSVGLPYRGRLLHGTRLPLRGPDWVTWNPVTDRVPNAPNRLYGNERTIRAILAVTRAYRAANPQAPRVVVGDISRNGGGPMADEHVSHQNGLDVDVYYPRRDGELRAPRTRDQVDRRLAQDLLDRFVAAGAHMVFVGYSTGLRGPAGVVVPYSAHENHMHVRFPPPGRRSWADGNGVGSHR